MVGTGHKLFEKTHKFLRGGRDLIYMVVALVLFSGELRLRGLALRIFVSVIIGPFNKL